MKSPCLIPFICLSTYPFVLNAQLAQPTDLQTPGAMELRAAATAQTPSDQEMMEKVQENSGERTIEQIGESSLVRNGTLADRGGAHFKHWSSYPQGTKFIEPVSASDSATLDSVQFQPGAAILFLRSEPIAVEPKKAYTLIFDLQQENIPIGFDMGGEIRLNWSENKNGPWQPQVLDLVDGDFSWKMLSYGVNAPPHARFVQILVGKKGSPGKVAYRHIRFAQGILKRQVEELSVKELFATREAFRFLSRRSDYFLADKENLKISGVHPLKEEMNRVLRVQEGEMTERLDRLATGAGALSPDQQLEIKWAEMLKGNLGFKVAPDSPYYEAWKKAGDQLAAMETTVRDWLQNENHQRLKAEMKAVHDATVGYAVGVDSTMQKVLRDHPYTGSPKEKAEIALARNEEEGVQITVAALDSDLTNLSVVIDPLKTKEGTLFPTDQLNITRIDFVKTNPPQYDVDVVGWWPDIVYPENTADRIAKGSNQSFWVNASTTAETPAGVYHGQIKILQGDTTLMTLPLEVEVWNLTLPKPGKFKVVGRFNAGQFSTFYGEKASTPEALAEWNRFIFAKRWNSTDPFVAALTPRGASLQAAAEEGLNSAILLNVSSLLEYDREHRKFGWPDAEREKAIKEAVKERLAEFEATVGKSDAVLYITGFDEQHDLAQYPLMKHVFELAKEVAPHARIQTTTTYSPLKELVGSVDTWVPLLGHDTEELRERQAAGDELFFYVYAHPFHPFPNPAQIDYAGVEGRVTFWIAANKGYSGFLHWLMNGWVANSQSELRWPKAPWIPYARAGYERRNGEGYFLYPGPDGKPISSVRFELIRDGIEDWELIELLKEAVSRTRKSDPSSPVLAEAVAALSEGMALAPEADRYTLDPEQLLKVRARIAHAVMALEDLKK